ncbi:MAG TPA: SulP family inorganic anion transporter, partial [Anaerolineales bacterium]
MAKPSFISRTFASEFQLAALPRSIAAGVLMFLLEVIIVISFTAFIFSGPLTASLPYGIGFLIAGDAVLCAVVALLSSYAGSVAVEQDVPSAVLAVAIASLLAALPSAATPAQQFSTVIMMIVSASLLTGVFFTLLGVLKLGKLVRFLPYPVMGGFLAGTGYLLTTGGIGVMLGTSANSQMLMPDQWLRWAPGLALGALMLYAVERYKNPLIIPGTFAFGLLAFYAVAWLMHTTPAQLSLGGWLLGPFPSGSLWQFPLNFAMQGQVNWPALLSQWPSLATIAVVSVVALLLNASGLELIIKRDIDLNRELITAGVANLAGGLAGGTVGYHAISLSGLSHSVSGGKRLSGLLVAVLMGVLAVAGPSLFGYVPRMVLAGLLVFLGLGLLVEWVYRAWFHFPRIDFLILLTILIVIALRGFLEGVGVGLVLAIILFVVSYSRIPLSRFAVSGKTYRSRVQRSMPEQD